MVITTTVLWLVLKDHVLNNADISFWYSLEYWSVHE